MNTDVHHDEEKPDDVCACGHRRDEHHVGGYCDECDCHEFLKPLDDLMKPS